MTTFSIPMWAYWLIAIGLLVTIGIIFTLSLCRAAKGPQWHHCNRGCGTLLPGPGACEPCLRQEQERERRAMRRYEQRLSEQRAERN